MILYRDYNEKTKLDRIWYSSSSLLYSECIDNENELKTLIVVFKNGSTYQYDDVDVMDYVMFVHGGLDNSNGKALNTFIKKKCPYKKIENKNIEELQKELDTLKEKEKNKE